MSVKKKIIIKVEVRNEKCRTKAKKIAAVRPGTFEVDISNTKKLLEGERGRIVREKDIIVVGESGLFTPNDIVYVHEARLQSCK
ncbi:hypothetical protein K1719_020012 [Acacia pycnantha]|nr:hypothetical protein K1719_020008 [Acacia pycnantha]KAI9109057.1 hypothetical protein K1719_020012 [Acacia pycnantha]